MSNDDGFFQALRLQRNNAYRQRDQLRQKLRNLEMTNQSLKNRIYEYQAHGTHQLRQKLRNLEMTNQSLKNRIYEYQAHGTPLRDLQIQNELLKSKLDDLKRKHMQFKRKHNLLLEDDTKASFDEKGEENNILRNHIEKLEEELGRYMLSYTNVKEVLGNVSKNFQKSKNNCEQLEKNNDNLDRLLNKTRKERDSALAELDLLKSQKESSKKSTGQKKCQLKTKPNVGCQEMLSLDRFHKGQSICKECSRKRKKRKRGC
jgi:chromosome segregation ATPase